MHPRSLSAAVVLFAAVLLTACTTGQPEPGPTSATPTPVPDDGPALVGAGEKPPAVFEDCAGVLSDAEAAEAVGVALTLEPPGDEHVATVNLGGITCDWADWEGTRTHLSVTVFPSVQLRDLPPPFASWPSWEQPECDWYCAASVPVGPVTVVATLNAVPEGPGSPAERMGAIAASLADTIAGRVDVTRIDSWERDRTGWHSVEDCAALSDPLSERLGMSVEVSTGHPYVDPPLEGGMIGDRGTGLWACTATSPSGKRLTLSGQAGTAWSAPSGLDAAGYPAGWRGAPAQEIRELDGEGPGETFTDGVNLYQVTAPEASFGADAATVARAMAATLAATR